MIKTDRFNRKILLFGLCFVAIGYVYSIVTTSLGLILFIFSWLLNYKEIRFKNFFKLNSINLLSLFFIVILIGATYSLDYNRGGNLIVRQLSFIILPLIFLSIPPLNTKEKKFVIKIYITALTIFFIICFTNAIYRQLIFSLGGGHFNWYFFYRYDLLEIFNQHPTYVSMFTLLSLSFMLFSSERFFKPKWIEVGILAIHLIGILLSGSRIGYLTFCLLFLLYASNKICNISRGERIKKISIFLTIALFMLFTAWNIPIVKERILYTIGYKYNYKFNNKESVQKGNPEAQGRLLLWKDAMELIELKPFFGYGTGSNMQLLKRKYQEKNHTLFLKQEYNTHNTYLEVLLSGGLIRLFFYLLILSTILYSGIIRNNLVLVSFFLIIGVTSFTETIFRAQGIVFFAFFYCFLLSTNE